MLCQEKSDAERSGCDLMTHGPIYSSFEANFHGQDTRCSGCCNFTTVNGTRKIKKLLISANYHGQRIAKRRRSRRFPRVPALYFRRIVR